MFANLKLSHKGLALVGILLLLELVFVGALAALLNKAEQAARIENHSKEIVGKTNHVIQLLYDAGNAAADYQHDDGNNPEADRRFHTAADKLPAELSSLKELVKDNPDYLKRVTRVEKSTLRNVKLVSEIMALAEKGRTAEAMMTAAKGSATYDKLKHATFAEFRALMSEQEKIITESPARQARSRELEKQLLFAGVGFNVLIAVGLSLFLVRGITRRLDIMVTNTRLLVKNEPLFPPLTGADEIAQLDHSFHEMARTLKELEEIKRQFVAMVSHDLRTPLTSLQMFLELLEMGKYGQLNELGEQRTTLSQRSVTRLIALINDLLDFERLQSGQFSLNKATISLSPVVGRSIEAVNAFAEKHKVKLVAEPIDCQAIADSERLVQVLVNLISNAVKFSQEGGVVTVSARRIENWVEVRVKDHGRGVPKEFHQTVFERFKQVKKTDATEKGGTGLGLPICKALVECHGGKIGIESEEGQGATFWFTLPGADPNIASALG
jgi:signal transduction histidine kinase